MVKGKDLTCDDPHIGNNPFHFKDDQYKFNPINYNLFDFFGTGVIELKLDFAISAPLLQALDYKTLAMFTRSWLCSDDPGCSGLGICIHTNTRIKATSPGASSKLVLPDTAGDGKCKFVVGRGEAQRSFSVSKLLLARASEVFLAMFYGALPESDVVQLPDMETEVFEQLLEAITLEEWQPTSRLQAKEVYVAAHKYMVTRVLDCCLDFIWPASNDYFQALDLATQLDLDYLLRVVIVHVRSGSREVFRGREIENISQASLLAIVEEPRLNVCEMDLFDAAMRWAKARCYDRSLPGTGVNMRAQLGKVLSHIRFLAMTEAELNDWPFKSGVLTPLEMENIKGVKDGDGTLRPIMICPPLSSFTLNRNKN